MKKVGQFNGFEDREESRSEACLVCEAMCPDAVDGTLTEGEQRAFEKHVAGCSHCAQELEDAQRGAAWLGMLKSGKPEPPATLLTRILAETTGLRHETETERQASLTPPPPLVAPLPPPAPFPPVAGDAWAQTGRGPQLLKPASVPHKADQVAPQGGGSWRGKVLNFRGTVQRFGAEGTGSSLHPRLAMTAAMAFFSIALTLNLTGVHLRELHAEDFKPASLQRSAAEARATAVRSFQNLKVVYQVESRVSELQQDPMWDERTERPLASATGTPEQVKTLPQQDRH